VPETLESLRASFNRSLRVEGKADRTLVLYGQSITYFSAWLVEKGLPAELSSLTRDNVLGWLDTPRQAIAVTVAVPVEPCAIEDGRQHGVLPLVRPYSPSLEPSCPFLANCCVPSTRQSRLPR